MMDLLLDINESPQIPFERRIDLNLDDEDDDELDCGDDDAGGGMRGELRWKGGRTGGRGRWRRKRER